MTEPNMELLEKTMARVEALPEVPRPGDFDEYADELEAVEQWMAENGISEAWDQEMWLHRYSCGTAGCFAGWCVVEAGYKLTASAGGTLTADPDQPGLPVPHEGRTIDRLAQHLLGIDRYTAEALFSSVNTKEDLREMVERIKAGERAERVYGPTPHWEWT